MTKPRAPAKPHPRKTVRGKQYPGVRGKVVDFLEHAFEENQLYIHVRFMDKTEVTFILGSRLVLAGADLSDISTGDYKLIQEYVPYET
jgi:hypothetical protein